jgi:hypothetical protein
VVSAASLAAAACGRKLTPEAPLQVIPARVQPLRVTQEGADVVLRFPYPSVTTQGTELTGLSKVTIYRELLAAREGARPPQPAEDGSMREREEKEFLTKAQILRTLTRGDLDEATSGSDVVVRDPLLPLYKEKRLGRVFLRYGITATREKKRTSALSPLVAVLPRVPPDRPLALVATVEEKRVCLDWLRPEAMLDASLPVVAGAYAVYRREAGEEDYGPPLGIAEKITLFIDETIQPERKYLYTVRAAPTADRPLVLGAAADEVKVDTHDVFPPPLPEGLIVLGEDIGNRLVWNPVLAGDLAGYRVYRWDPEASRWKRIADGVKDTGHFDAEGKPKARYGVSAYDKSGNESAVAPEAKETKKADE